MNNMPVNSTTKIQKEIRDISDLLVSKVNPYMVVLFGSHAGPMQLDVAIRKAKKSGYSYIKSDLK